MTKASKPSAARAKPGVAQGPADAPEETKRPAQAVAEPETLAIDDSKAVPAYTHRIAGAREQGFWRAGRKWPREGEDVHRDEFTDEQWAALEGEPLLTITTL